MKGPYSGCVVFLSINATLGFAGSSPTTSSQSCMASSEVMNARNLAAATALSSFALDVIALTQ